MALLHAANQAYREKVLKFPAVAIHINHNIRTDSYIDQSTVEDFCFENSILFIAKNIYPDQIESMGKGVECGARELRYGMICDFTKEIEYNMVFTAHHAQDRLETILMRMGEGAGINGMVGPMESIIKNGVEIARPLLQFWPNELEEYRRSNSVPFAQDNSNFSYEYKRNKIRLDICPAIRDGLDNKKLSDSFQNLQEDYEVMSLLLEEKVKEIIIKNPSPNKIEISFEKFKKIDEKIQKAILLKISKEVSFGRINKKFIINLMKSIQSKSPKIEMGNKILVFINKDKIVFMGSSDPKKKLAEIRNK